MDKNKKLFPQRLWELIHDEKYNFCLRWSPDGQRVYLNRNDFETHYLKTPNNQFHTQKAISFVRQMNMYGFRKVDDCYYENDNFKRNCHHLLKNMVRRHSNKGFFSPSSTNSNQQSHTNSHSNRQNNSNRNNIITSNSNISNNINRHHANLATTIPQHLFNNHHQPQQIPSYQHQQSNINLSSVEEARASIIGDIERQTSAATTVAAAAQCFRGAGGSVGNIGAALAAINSSNNQAQGAAVAAAATAAASLSTTRSPLPSTLYHRLAALNFDQSNNQANEQLLQQRQYNQQQRPSNNPPVVTASSTPLTATTNFVQENTGNPNQVQIDAATNRGLLQRAPLYEQQFPFLNIPMSTLQEQQQQSSLAARQATQQNLIRSFLQLKQPQVPLTIQQNLLASLQQQNPNLLLESLASLSSAIHVAQMNNQSSGGGGGGTLSPLELVVNPMPSSTSDNHDQRNPNQFQQLITATTDNIDPNSLINLAGRPDDSMTRSGIGEGSPQFNNVIQVEEEDYELDGDDGDDCTDDFEDDLFSNNSSSNNNDNRNIGILGNISSSSSSSTHESSRHCTQNLDDLNNTVLDLAKPSSARYNGRFRT